MTITIFKREVTEAEKVDREVKEELERLKIQLADDTVTEKPIDILIGNDQQVNFMTHNATRLLRTETALGWTHFGCKEGESGSGVGTRGHQATACPVSKGQGSAGALPSRKKREEVEDELEPQFRSFVGVESLQLGQEKIQSEEEFGKSPRKNRDLQRQRPRIRREAANEDSLTTKLRIVFDASAKEKIGCGVAESQGGRGQ